MLADEPRAGPGAGDPRAESMTECRRVGGEGVCVHVGDQLVRVFVVLSWGSSGSDAGYIGR